MESIHQDSLGYWKNVETKGKPFGLKSVVAFHHKNHITSVKNVRGSIMICACFTASGPGPLTIIELKKENVCILCFLDTTTSNMHYTVKRLNKLNKVLLWLSESPDLKGCRSETDMQGSQPVSLGQSC